MTNESDRSYEIKRIIYQEAANLARQHENLLFQRFNYFLLANSFLTIAFVAAALNSSRILANLTILLGFTGFLISWLFCGINFHNAKVLRIVFDKVKYLERLLVSMEEKEPLFLPYNQIHGAIFRHFEFGIIAFLVNPINSVAYNFSILRRNVPGPHTWMVPLCFAFFWLIAVGIYGAFIGNLLGFGSLTIVIAIWLSIIAAIVYLKAKHSKESETNIFKIPTPIN